MVSLSNRARTTSVALSDGTLVNRADTSKEVMVSFASTLMLWCALKKTKANKGGQQVIVQKISYGVPIVVFLALMRRFGYDLESVERDILIVMMKCWIESWQIGTLSGNWTNKSFFFRMFRADLGEDSHVRLYVAYNVDNA